MSFSQGFSYGMVVKVQKVAVIALIKNKDYYLIVNHFNRGWDIPGGYINEGEDIVSALKREVFEETNFVVKNYSLKVIFSNIQPEILKGEKILKIIFGFVCDFASGTFLKNKEVSEYKFIKKEEAKKYISNKLQLTRFYDLINAKEQLLYIAYQKTPYIELVREIITK